MACIFVPSIKIFPGVEEPTSCSSATAVAQGYQLYNGKYYLIHPTSGTSVDDARAACQAAGADLAVFKTEEDYQAIHDITSEGGHGRARERADV